MKRISVIKEKPCILLWDNGARSNPPKALIGENVNELGKGESGQRTAATEVRH